MDKPVIRSERYRSIITISIGLSIVGIMIFNDIPKMFTKGYLVIDHWQLGDILKPLLILCGFLFFATKYLAIKNRIFKEGIVRLRPKYLSILRGGFKKDLPGLEDLRVELVEKIERSIRPKTKLLLYDDLYAITLLLGVLQAEEGKAPIELKGWLKEKGYPDKGGLGLFDKRVRGLLRDEVSLFRFIEVTFFRENRLCGPKWKILSQALRHEFYKVDDLPSYLGEFRYEEISREGLVGIFTSMIAFLSIIGGGIFGVRNHPKN